MFIGTILDSASFNIQRNFFKKENFKENTLYLVLPTFSVLYVSKRLFSFFT